MFLLEDVRTLAGVVSPEGCITFYFRPETSPTNAHSEERLVIKELVKEQLKQLRGGPEQNGVREALERIAFIGRQLKGNHSVSKAIFACPEKNIWQEFDLPGDVERTTLVLNSRFHLGPLVTTLSNSPAIQIALVDKERARFFELRGNSITEADGFRDDLPRNVRSDGFRGYDAGHIERHFDNSVMQHMKRVADRLKISCENEAELVFVGCHDETWPFLEPHLHAYVLERMGGHFTIDPGGASPQQVRQEVERLLAERRLGSEQEFVQQAIGEAERNARGAAGLKHVLTALERGEVQSIIVNRDLRAKISECASCGHLDTRMVANCALCGQSNREIEDVLDALVSQALRSSADIIFTQDAALEQAGNVAALLRFRADQNTAGKLAG